MTRSNLGINPWIFPDRKDCQKRRNIARKFCVTSTVSVCRPGIEPHVGDTCPTRATSGNMHLEFGFTSLPALTSSLLLDILD
jgi:hypothetical protein